MLTIGPVSAPIGLFPKKTTVVKLVLLKNESFAKYSTEAGMVTVVRLQPEKAPVPIVLSTDPDAKVRLVKEPLS